MYLKNSHRDLLFWGLNSEVQGGIYIYVHTHTSWYIHHVHTYIYIYIRYIYIVQAFEPLMVLLLVLSTIVLSDE